MKSWQLRSVLTMAILLNSATDADMTLFKQPRAKSNDPIRARATLDLAGDPSPVSFSTSGDGRNGATTIKPSSGLSASTRLRISGNGSPPRRISLRTSKRLNWFKGSISTCKITLVPRGDQCQHHRRAKVISAMPMCLAANRARWTESSQTVRAARGMRTPPPPRRNVKKTSQVVRELPTPAAMSAGTDVACGLCCDAAKSARRRRPSGAAGAPALHTASAIAATALQPTSAANAPTADFRTPMAPTTSAAPSRAWFPRRTDRRKSQPPTRTAGMRRPQFAFTPSISWPTAETCECRCPVRTAAQLRTPAPGAGFGLTARRQPSSESTGKILVERPRAAAPRCRG